MKTLALVAHNKKKNVLLEWAKENKKILKKYRLVGTSHTADLLNNVLELNVEKVGHGPKGGDILLAAKMIEGEIDKVIFFIDSETPHGHEHDIQTLIRTAVINNIPIALNRASANYIIPDKKTDKILTE